MKVKTTISVCVKQGTYQTES